jgi:hypothetical protein
VLASDENSGPTSTASMGGATDRPLQRRQAAVRDRPSHVSDKPDSVRRHRDFAFQRVGPNPGEPGMACATISNVRASGLLRMRSVDGALHMIRCADRYLRQQP